MDNYKSLLMETISKNDLVSKPAKIKRAGKLKEDLLPDEVYNTLVRKSKKTYTVGVYSTLPGPGWHYEINTEYGVYAKVPDEEGFIAHWFLQGLPQESEEDVERVAKRIITQYDCKEVSLNEYKRIINGKDESLTEDLNRSFVELESFKKSWRELGLSEDDLKELQNLILTYPEVAIPLGSNVFKVRFSPSSLNKGKDTSTRVIYIDIIKDSLIYLVTAFSKSNEKNISSKELRAIKDIAKEL